MSQPDYYAGAGPDPWETERRALQQRRPEPDGDALLEGARAGNPYYAILWLEEHGMGGVGHEPGEP